MHVGDWPARWAIYAPNKVAVEDGDTGRKLTYFEFDRRISRLAAALFERHCVRKGDRIAILAHNGVPTLELLFAVARLGAILVPLNWRLTPGELSWAMAKARPRLLFFGPSFAELAASAATLAFASRPDDLPSLEPLGDASCTAPEGPYETLIQSGSGTVSDVAIAPEDPLLILFTSGTTGRQKGAVLTHGSVTWNAINTEVGWDLRQDDVTLTLTPFFHTGGLNVLTTPLLFKGGTVVLTKQFDADQALSLVGRAGCTVMFAVPTMFQLMAESPRFGAADLTHVRFFITGGAPCPLPLIEIWARRGVVFKQGYGLTEAGPNCFTLDAQDAVRKAGTVGFPNPSVDMRIVTPDGTAVGPADVGELWIRGPHLFKGYWEDPEATAAAFEEGWLRTGDLASRDTEGYTAIVDRLKDMFISGGENIYPAEIERFLSGHPAIAEVAVIGVPDERWGEVGRAVVVVRPGVRIEATDLIDYLADRLARYKLPKSVVFAAYLPRNAAGKLDKPRIRNLHGRVRGVPTEDLADEIFADGTERAEVKA